VGVLLPAKELITFLEGSQKRKRRLMKASSEEAGRGSEEPGVLHRPDTGGQEGRGFKDVGRGSQGTSFSNRPGSKMRERYIHRGKRENLKTAWEM